MPVRKLFCFWRLSKCWCLQWQKASSLVVDLLFHYCLLIFTNHKTEGQSRVSSFNQKYTLLQQTTLQITSAIIYTFLIQNYQVPNICQALFYRYIDTRMSKWRRKKSSLLSACLLITAPPNKQIRNISVIKTICNTKIEQKSGWLL